jgi:hypothetical protein
MGLDDIILTVIEHMRLREKIVERPVY